MSNFGRPTAYKPEYCELAHNYCLLGATAEELAGFFGVTRGTINNWIASIPEFAAALREGRDLADGRIARCLYKRAMGYDHKVKRITECRGEEKTLTTELHFPPDTHACIFWLRNRRRRNWNLRAEALTEGPDIAALLDVADEGVRDAAE
jgi:hypothetical protein